MAAYDFAEIERKWQARWADSGTFTQPNPGDEGFRDKPKFYVLDMFPYPSGAGLHVGHPVGYVATDVIARYKRMKGFNVLHPMGYDAFGLPAEQYAIEHGVHPRDTTEQNIANMQRQLKMFGFSYDWSRRIATTEPGYYHWTQWIFLQMFNSWYDPEADAARPIGELVRKLQSGEYVFSITGHPVRNVSDGLSPYLGDPIGTSKWHELPPQERRSFIDNQRLAYMAEVPVNWCPKLGTVLANEEVTSEGRSERGDYPVYRRAMKQWMLRITAYADRLLADLDLVDWPEPIKIMQRNWIGRSEGADVEFQLPSSEEVIRVYTTRPDTLFGATYMVLAPEHPLVDQITTQEHRKAVNEYVRQAARKSELERTAETKEKTGVFTSAYAINPVNDEKIPVWIADYVMMGYGTGAIMAVPAHDTRDFEFAEKFDLPIVQVVQPPDGIDWRGYVDDGIAVNSGKFDGLPTAEFKKKITQWLSDHGRGRAAVNYKLRDWIFSRQKYWGEPFPIVHCDECGTAALPESELPLELPEMEDFTPQTSDDPDAPPAPPLGRLAEWSETSCPECGGPAKRELNTMPQWAGSCWYYLRYLDPKNTDAFCDPKAEKYWMGERGVDLYVGGAEHAVLHLLYARFWHKVLYDLGCASTPEPFGKLFNQGMIRSFAYRDGRGVCVGYDKIDFRDDAAHQKDTGEKLSESVEKMSKSLRNVVTPDDVIRQYGADTFRMYEMFMGPLEASKPWNTRDVPGVHRFLQRVWRMTTCFDQRWDKVKLPFPQYPVPDDSEFRSEELERKLHKLVKKVSEDIEAMKFNTAIAAMMEFVNEVYRSQSVAYTEVSGKYRFFNATTETFDEDGGSRCFLSRSQAERFVLVLAPFAPHVAEELWARLGHSESLSHEPWPAYDKDKIAAEQVELAVQVNGKLRGRIKVAANADEQAVIEAALGDAKVAAAVEGKKIVKKIVVPGRLVNLVAK